MNVGMEGNEEKVSIVKNDIIEIERTKISPNKGRVGMPFLFIWLESYI
jgi:hypothetical protein